MKSWEQMDAGFVADVHGAAIPTEVRETDSVVARVRERGKSDDLQAVRVWRLSPLGVEILVDSDVKENFCKGTSVDLQLVVEGRRSEIVGYIVSLRKNAHGHLLGARFLSENKEETHLRDSDSRTAMRWICSEHHLPRAIASSPGRFNSFIGFQIRNISESGLMLVTDITNSFLIPKMRLTLSVSLPMVGETILDVELVWLRIGSSGGSDVLEIGAQLVGLDDRSKSLLGQYLVQFAQDVSVNSLIESGFTPKNIEQGIEFNSLQTEAEYGDLLQLRARVQGRNGHADVASHAHEADRMSRIIVGKVGGELIVSARVRYPELQDSLACEPAFVWPDDQPRPDQLIEVDGIFSLVPDREDAVLALFKYICTACTSDTRKTVVVYASDPALFESVGWSEIATTSGQHVLVCDAHEAIKGKKTNPIRWNYVWRDSALFLMKTDTFKPSGSDALILKLYLSLGPISKLIYSLKNRLS